MFISLIRLAEVPQLYDEIRLLPVHLLNERGKPFADPYKVILVHIGADAEFKLVIQGFIPLSLSTAVMTIDAAASPSPVTII
jgi:hypothetical protein